MDKISAILKTIGLSETEAKLYLAGLPYPSIGVSELEKQTRVRRTTIYHALSTLMQKGLVAKKEAMGRTVFSMTRPESIERLLSEEMEMLKKKKDELSGIIPLLRQRTAQEGGKTRVSHFEGIEGMKLVVEEALYCRSKRWDIIAPVKNFFSEFDRKYADYFIGMRKTRSIVARSLWEADANRRALTPEEIRQRQPRYLPKAMRGRFKSVIIIFDDKVAFISSLRELSAIMIQSQEIRDTMAALFAGLWQASEKHEKR